MAKTDEQRWEALEQCLSEIYDEKKAQTVSLVKIEAHLSTLNGRVARIETLTDAHEKVLNQATGAKHLGTVIWGALTAILGLVSGALGVKVLGTTQR